MPQTVIHIHSFQGKYKTGLVFSMIEGLKPGQGFKLICDQKPEELEILLKEAQIPLLKWSSRFAESNRWELEIAKKAS